MQHVEAVILAGGSGSRFGGGKLLAPYRGGALIDGAVRVALGSPVEKVILVTGHDGQRVGKAAQALATREYPQPTLQIVHADRHADGMAETLKIGLTALSAYVDGALVLLGDMPQIPASLPTALIRAIGCRAAAAPVHQAQRGHPVLLAARLFPQLMKLSGDRGARSILDTLGDDIALVAVDDAGVLFDVDFRSDIASCA